MKVKPKKALGQHFLTDQGIARRIAETLDIDPYKALPILEIGPGMGVLTQYLMEEKRPLKVVEIDTESVEYLHRVYPNLTVIEGDFLQMKADDFFSGEFALIGNYPYNISSQIFFRVLDFKERIPIVSGMLQREVAQRICAPEGNKVRGILSVLLQVWYDCEYLFTVDENVFNPPPKVKSGVIRLTRNGVTDPGCNPALLKTVVKTSFGQRRKTLRNSLSGLVPKESAVLKDPIMSERPERLSVEQFVDLTNLIAESRT
ncbi:MAG: 16S rRNA (adenine(1518)-N(6)/adenine(1519)-N(6))-dimethyltransferase RsmA [Prevotella sp.]|nr:16S rRNA (adenine(1518)-N(6)/adenine(1519)-N(6))-dimethyltransferase RsmA [Prevotella sp.]MCM1075145.1 16S rRNA (adenine(1518)-N(6)/adenine(1519)-N(6))-dimethyltransferase RsmA [Ruminococcus sp.]